MGARRFTGFAVAAVTVALVAVFGATPGPAGADTALTWSGSSTSPDWSQPANWGGSVLSNNEASIDLTFPGQTSCGGTTCETGTNDLSGLGLNSLDFSGTPFESPYTLGGQAVTLGSGGITSSMPATVSLPMQLTAAQTWVLDESALDLSGGLTGGSSALSVDLASNGNGVGTLGVAGDAELGSVTVTGAGDVTVTPGSSGPGSLNGINGNSVSVSSTSAGVHLIAGGPGTDDVGGLSVGSGGFVNLGGVAGEPEPVANLDVNGAVTFTASSGFADLIDSTGTTAGVDYGELTATGNIALNNASFNIEDDGGSLCPTDSEIGENFPLLSTSGTLSGQFGSGAGNGDIVSLGSSCSAQMAMHYTAHEVYGTVVNTTASPAFDLVSASPSPAVAGQTVTYTATVEPTAPSTVTPTGNVIFDDTTAGIVCTAILSGGTGSCTSNAAPVGLDDFDAMYSGDENYGGSTYGLQLTVNNPPPTSPAPTTPPAAAPHGYWLAGSDGGIFTFGSSQFYGSTGNLELQRPVVGISPTADLGGYWLVASDGGVFAYGDAGFVGSIPGLGLHPAGSGQLDSLIAPIVGMVPSRDGGGYFMVASDGGVFAFGDAHFAGSCPGIGGCSGSAVDVMPDASGNGYWIVTSSGNVYGFGDAAYDGSPGHGTVTSAVATPDGKGYWVLLSDGQVFAYGSAANLGSPPSGGFNAFDPANAIFATSDGGGYWVSSAAGAVDTFGDAPNDGSMAGTHLNGAIIAGSGY